MNFTDLLRTLDSMPELASAMTYDDAVTYIDLIRCLKPSISLRLSSFHEDPPDLLTLAEHDFLKACLQITDDVAKLAWATFSDVAWKTSPICETNNWAWNANAHVKYIGLFLEHGLCRGISALHSLYQVIDLLINL
jgi:hypothetical protein